MDKQTSAQSTLEKLLARWGGAYLLRMPSLTQLVSFFAAAVGIYYILINARLTRIQVIELFVSVFGFVTLVNIIIPIYTALATRNARLRLDEIFKGKPLPQHLASNEVALAGWNEVNILSWRYMFLEAATAYLLVVFPVVVFMRWIGGVSSEQAYYIVIGGVVSATAVVIQNFLFLEEALGPARNALFPANFSDRQFPKRTGLRARLQTIALALLFMTVAFMGEDELLQGKVEYYVLVALLLSPGAYLFRILARSITHPFDKIIATLQQFQAGDYSSRVPVFAADEAQQLTIQVNRLLDQLQISQTELEAKVEQRTKDLNIRTARLQAAAQISKEAASARDVQTLLARTVKLISERFGFYHTGIFLIDPAGEYAILQAASSEGGKKMLERGHRLLVGEQGLVGSAAYENQPRVATDVGQDISFFKNPDLPLTKSEAAIPMSARGKVIGVLDVQSTEEAAFSQEDIELLQTLADQIALAINNAQLIEESQATLAQLQSLLQENTKQSWRRYSGLQKSGYRYTPAGVTPIVHRENTSIIQTAFPESKRIDIPITLRGQTIGRLALTRKANADWSEEEQGLLQQIAAQVGLALENARLLAEMQQRAWREQSLSELSTQLSRYIDSDALLQAAARQLHEIPGIDEVTVYLAPTSDEEGKNDK